jgi:hypothetical protein
MKRRFAVAVENMTLTEDTAFVEWIRTKNLGWWHWIPGFWLITTKSGGVSTEDIRNQLRKITGRKDIMVLEIQKPMTWSGYGPRYARARHVQVDSRNVGRRLMAHPRQLARGSTIRAGRDSGEGKRP